eukprot:scaffold3037_cov230-Pinguiococcus_pyrenoidosus.AAC.8
MPDPEEVCEECNGAKTASEQGAHGEASSFAAGVFRNCAPRQLRDAFAEQKSFLTADHLPNSKPPS